MKNTIITLTHINDIFPGDTVEHQDVIMTVCASDIKNSSFMGTTLFGDSYSIGNRPVKKVRFF
jgi:hypothetical protein